MINVVIIENCDKSLNYLNHLLKPYEDISIIGTAASINEGYKLLQKTTPNILFLDIELDDGTAFDLLAKIKHKRFEIIFTTAFNNYYSKAFEHFAFNYLLKPIDIQKLNEVIIHYKNTKSSNIPNKLNNLNSFTSKENPKILLSLGYQHILVPLSEILYCQAQQNFTIFKFSSGKSEIISNSLKYYTDLFSEKGFFKANRSFLININHIKKIIKRESIIMTNNEVINVSTKQKILLKKLIENLS